MYSLNIHASNGRSVAWLVSQATFALCTQRIRHKLSLTILLNWLLCSWMSSELTIFNDCHLRCGIPLGCIRVLVCIHIHIFVINNFYFVVVVVVTHSCQFICVNYLKVLFIKKKENVVKRIPICIGIWP